MVWETYNVEEFAEQFSVEKEIGRRGELVGDSVEEDFWAVVFVLLVCALFALDSEETEFEHVHAVAEEDCFTACEVLC